MNNFVSLLFYLHLLLLGGVQERCCPPPCFCCSSCLCETSWNARVTRVIDGDTIEVAYKGETHKIRLLGVDTPETKNTHTGVQPFGKEASDFTKMRLHGQDVVVKFEEKRNDNFGRLVGYIYPRQPQGDSSSHNETLIRMGLGRYYPRFKFDPSLMKRFEEAEKEARSQGLGLWFLIVPPT